jgi:hypothetical protein
MRGSHVHCVSIDGLGARLCPCGIVTTTPWTFTVTSQARPINPPKSSPTTPIRYAPHTSPDPPGSSWQQLKRLYNTGSSRTPSRLAHRARPIRQCSIDPTLSRLLPPSPASPGSGCRQLHRPATTGQQQSPPTSTRNHSASWRTIGVVTDRRIEPLGPGAGYRHIFIALKGGCARLREWFDEADPP